MLPNKEDQKNLAAGKDTEQRAFLIILLLHCHFKTSTFSMKIFPQGFTMLISSELQYFKSNITLFGIATKTIATSLPLIGISEEIQYTTTSTHWN